MENYLESKKYKIKETQSRGKHGIDIEAKQNSGPYYFIEVKGCIKGHPYGQLIDALGQILLRMRQKKGHYGVALPADSYFTEKNRMGHKYLTDYLSQARGRLKLEIFLVTKKEEILKLTPECKKFKKVKV